MTDASVKSPCVAVCALDEDDVCLGCFRTADEITDWFMASDDEKRAIVTRSQERRSAKQSIKLR
jgi:predicted Fe-S protein YdhL (DUF1289 family)